MSLPQELCATGALTSVLFDVANWVDGRIHERVRCDVEGELAVFKRTDRACVPWLGLLQTSGPGGRY